MWGKNKHKHCKHESIETRIYYKGKIGPEAVAWHRTICNICGKLWEGKADSEEYRELIKGVQ